MLKVSGLHSCPVHQCPRVFCFEVKSKMFSCRVLLLLALASGSAIVSTMATAPRTRENFDTDWRFHLGEVATTPAADCTEGKFPEPLNGVQCLGLQSHVN